MYGAIYLIASYDFFINRLSCYAINQQQLQVAKLAHTTEAPDCVGAHRIKRTHNFYFILFVSSGLDMCDRLNSLICNDRLHSCERVEYSLTCLNLLRLMRLIMRCTLCMKK